MAQEVDEYLKAITTCKGVEGVVIITKDGFPIRTSLDEELASLYAGIFSHLTMKADKALIKALDSADELRLIRLRSKKHEILIAPDKEYIMIIIQIPQVD
ncbi:Roadblock-related dynein light chain [Spironucleus salmonicida]|uniref:Dynein light chain roadblock n=1 Tax=Spironucleus salmonicida TaxID=348837 RepID=V6LCU3_9EUKA|nr:Roadblock-related dynein light chain [Spironucleus salmonicida]|eukprot:EST42073.1 Dynein light chain [Spironucleus salmonicida]